jgi:hypothetical protein
MQIRFVFPMLVTQKNTRFIFVVVNANQTNCVPDVVKQSYCGVSHNYKLSCLNVNETSIWLAGTSFPKKKKSSPLLLNL